MKETMRKIITTTLLSLLLALGGRAATMGELIVGEPGSVLPTLAPEMRTQMVKTYQATSKKVATANRMQGSSKLLQLDERHALLSTSQSATVELQLLVSGKDSVIAVIETVKLPAPDSRISFWSTKWQPLKTEKYFKAPTMADFAKAGADKAKVQSLIADLQFPVITYTFAGPTHNVLVAEQRLSEFLGKKDYQKYEPLLRDRIGYAVTGTKLKRTTTR